MKATPFTNISAGQNWFTTNIYAAATFAVTLGQFIMSVIRKSSSAVSVTYIDRNPDDVEDKGKIVVGGENHNSVAHEAQGSTLLMQLDGEKDIETKQLRFGVGDATPTAIKEAIESAIQGLNLAGEIDAGLAGQEGVPSALRAMLVPNMATTTLKGVLDRLFDLMPVVRAPEDATHRIIVVFNQGTQTGTIRVFKTPVANIGDLDNNATFAADVVAPETASAITASERLFGE